MRSEPPEKLERSPLVLVLVQIRFSAVLMMRQYVPEIQERLRKDGVPRYEEQQIQHIVFGPGNPQSIQGMRWRFGSLDEHEDVMLADDALVYASSDYGVFEDFLKRLVVVVDVLHDLAKIELVTQIGLRYLNLIRELDGHAAEWFLKEQIKGLSTAGLGIDKVENQMAVIATTPEGRLTIRCFERTGPRFVPPDLEDCRLKFDVSINPEEAFRILDFDHVTRRESTFNSPEIAERMWALHDPINQAFRAAVTEDAMSLWKMGKGS